MKAEQQSGIGEAEHQSGSEEEPAKNIVMAMVGGSNRVVTYTEGKHIKNFREIIKQG